MRNSSLITLCVDCKTFCHQLCKCGVARNKKLEVEAKAKVDQIKIENFQCVCGKNEDATECDYCFEMMMTQDRLKNHKTGSHECANYGDRVDNARLCHTCYVNTLV